MNSVRNDPVWLVEWPASDNMPARWWDCVGGWMLDANKATHFSREQDAAGYITTTKMVVGVKATEHKFLARLSEPEPAKQPAIDLEKIAAIDRFLEDGQRDKGYRAFVMMRQMWPQLKALALPPQERT